MTIAPGTRAAGEDLFSMKVTGSLIRPTYRVGKHAAPSYGTDGDAVTAIHASASAAIDRGIVDGSSYADLPAAHRVDHTIGPLNTQAGRAAFVTTGATRRWSAASPALSTASAAAAVTHVHWRTVMPSHVLRRTNGSSSGMALTVAAHCSALPPSGGPGGRR
ncbi:hypothetical protein ACWKWC_01590 [Geodermatophilus nigrescens]